MFAVILGSRFEFDYFAVCIRSSLAVSELWAAWTCGFLWNVNHQIHRFSQCPFTICWSEMSRLMTKPTKWYVRPAKTQISLGIRPVWSESSLSAWRKLGSLATHWARSEVSDQTGWMPRLIWVFAGRTVILFVLSCGELKCFHNDKWQFQILIWFTLSDLQKQTLAVKYSQIIPLHGHDGALFKSKGDTVVSNSSLRYPIKFCGPWCGIKFCGLAMCDHRGDIFHYP